MIEFHATDTLQTDRLAKAIADCAEPGTTIALCGTLGAGKTRLVQGLARALGIDPKSVVSPTFSLMQFHRGRLELVHVDAYRIADEDEFLELGIEELFESHSGIIAIEWADRFPGLLPSDFLQLRIDVAETGDRLFQLSAVGNDEGVTRSFSCLSDRMARESGAAR